MSSSHLKHTQCTPHCTLLPSQRNVWICPFNTSHYQHHCTMTRCEFKTRNESYIQFTCPLTGQTFEDLKSRKEIQEDQDSDPEHDYPPNTSYRKGKQLTKLLEDQGPDLTEEDLKDIPLESSSSSPSLTIIDQYRINAIEVSNRDITRGQLVADMNTMLVNVLTHCKIKNGIPQDVLDAIRSTCVSCYWNITLTNLWKIEYQDRRVYYTYQYHILAVLSDMKKDSGLQYPSGRNQVIAIPHVPLIKELFPKEVQWKSYFQRIDIEQTSNSLVHLSSSSSSPSSSPSSSLGYRQRSSSKKQSTRTTLTEIDNKKWTLAREILHKCLEAYVNENYP